MIYLVTANQELFEAEEYKIIGVEESLSLLRPLKIIGVDTETSGLNCHRDELLSVQLGCYDFQVVIDCTTIDIRLYRELLESDNVLLLFWNARFDLKWLYRYNIIPKRVYDGFLAEKLMWLGYPVVLSVDVWLKIKEERYTFVPEDPKKKKKAYYILYMNLKKAGEMYCGVELDKSIRGKIIYDGLKSVDTIVYAAEDVKYLEKIKDAQVELLKKQGLVNAMDYECRFILSLAYMEYCGVKLDVEKWKLKMKQDNKQLIEREEALTKWLIQNDPNNPRIFVDYQGDLFSGFNLEPQVNINWNSGKQVIPIFKKWGVEVTTEDGKDSIDAKSLAPQADKCSLIPLYIKYKEAKKLTSTYGQNFIDQLDKHTGRIYTNWNPIGTDTGRISSGGKDKANKIQYINFLNLPADALTRSCFIAEKGNKWISIDYSGQESFIMASLANDKAMIEELTNGSQDLHSLTAYMSYKQIPRGTPLKTVKKEFHDLRQEAKGIEFAINYGGNADTIHRNKGIPIEEANEIYRNYMEGFSGLKRYQDFRRKDWRMKGFIDLNPVVGYKAHIYDLSYLNQLQESFKEPGFWEYYREMKKIDKNCDTCQKVKEYFTRKADSEKQSINYPIQHTGALCYKVSMINFFEYLRRNNLLFKVLITVTPYDEINCEAPEEIANEVAQVLYDCMVKAGAYFCTRCKLDADISWDKDSEGKELVGQLPTYWIH